MRAAIIFAIITAVTGTVASASVQLNEIGYDMPGTDNGKEFVELRGTPGESLDGLTYLIVEGDAGASGGGGVVEHSIALDGYSIGSNGLFLIRDAATDLVPVPAAGTNVLVHDFNPDIENNSSNHLLVRGLDASLVSVGTDLDGPGGADDGAFDTTPWLSLEDSLTMLENSGVEYSYASTSGNISPLAAGFNPDFAVRLDDGQWVAVYANNGNAAGSGSGPYSLSASGVEVRRFSDGSIVPASALVGATLTPGSANPSLVPEPVLAMSAASAIAVVRRRRR